MHASQVCCSHLLLFVNDFLGTASLASLLGGQVLLGSHWIPSPIGPAVGRGFFLLSACVGESLLLSGSREDSLPV